MDLKECEHCKKLTGTLHHVVHPQSGAQYLCSRCVMEINLTRSFGDALHPTRDLQGGKSGVNDPSDGGLP